MKRGAKESRHDKEQDMDGGLEKKKDQTEIESIWLWRRNKEARDR